MPGQGTAPANVSQLYNAIKAQEPNFPVPQPTATITVGTLPAVTVTAFRSGTALADPMTRTSGDTVQVQVTHTFVPIFFVAHGYIPDVIGGLGVSIPMGSTAKMRVE